MNRFQKFAGPFIIRDSLPMSRIAPSLFGVPLVRFIWILLHGGTAMEATEHAAFLLFLFATMFAIIEAVVRYKNRPISAK
jgi:hypothetical protein